MGGRLIMGRRYHGGGGIMAAATTEAPELLEPSER